ncbi:hypothetical protein [Endozoicomonas sp. ALD040]|uniref:hypothetical protein n=1 Tax=unclassified Endozoicomonas TaxID=2644528 RepID=UPI003BB1D305
MKKYRYISLSLIPLWLSADSTIPSDGDNRFWKSPYEQSITEIENEDKKHNLNKYIYTELSKESYLYVNVKNNLELEISNKADFEGQSKSYRDNYSRYSKTNFNKPNILKAALSSVPNASEIDGNAIHGLKNIDFILSGGTWKPYSLAVAKNHLAFSKARRTNYKFVLFSQNSQDDDSVDLMNWMQGMQPYWGKIFLIKKFLKEGRVKPGKWIAWIDDDIVINDFKNDQSHLDKIIDSVDEKVCIITSRDYWYYEESDFLDGGHLPNTGIIMVKNTSYCSDIVGQWLNYGDDPDLGKNTQEYTLHEQEALAKLKRNFGRGSSVIKFIRNRTRDWDFNTFKRFNHFYNGSQANYNSDTENERAIAALINDAYIHHTGMASLYRLALIAHSLFEISGNYPRIQNADDDS